MPRAYGPPDSDILIVGDYPDSTDAFKGRPLTGQASAEALSIGMTAMKQILSGTRLTTIMETPAPEWGDVPPELSPRKTCPGPGWEWEAQTEKWASPAAIAGRNALRALIARHPPRMVVACGELALWACTGLTGVHDWRGSRLSPPDLPCPVVPTLALQSMRTMPENRHIFTIDFARAGAIFRGEQLPRHYDIQIRPSFETVVETLDALIARAETGPLRLAGDLETRLYHIACFGIAWSETQALVIPFTWLEGDGFPWTVDQEAIIISLISVLFLHENVTWVGQNFLYDCQYFERYWGVLPRNVFDTMIGHHSIYSNMKKGLGFLSSMYAQDHIYWKDEGKEWNPKVGEAQYWNYNGKDACITWEITPEILKEQESAPHISSRVQQHYIFQQSLFFPVLRMMLRGTRYNEVERARLSKELLEAGINRQTDLDYVAGHPLNPKSPKQLSAFLYNDLGIPGVKNLAGDSLTTNSPAIALIAERDPALKALCQLIVEIRSIGVFRSTFIEAKTDIDGRMRSAFGIAGPETFRFNSRENAFGSGMNMQNIPISEKAKIKSEDYIKLPNVRKLVVPDPGFTFFDMDLDRADLQVVVWEADDKDMKKALRLGLDMHCVNACDIFEIKGIPYEELQESHPNYKEHRGKIGEAKRGKAKAGVHATNYGVGDRKLAMALGITVAEAGRFRSRWFGAHPGVLRWHKRVEHDGTRRGYIENKFGARLYTLGRFDLPVALGWGPQSTVAGVINRALVAIDAAERRRETNVQLLIQVHDSLAGQFPTKEKEASVATLLSLSKIVIPYDDPLIIPSSVNCSAFSWGDCK